MKVVVASDHGGMNIRKELVNLLEELNIEYIDLGCECEAGSVDYPDFAFPAAGMVANGERVIGAGLARDIAKIWLTTEFEGGRHENRVGKIKTYEAK